jgi:hypothetical protein
LSGSSPYKASSFFDSTNRALVSANALVFATNLGLKLFKFFGRFFALLLDLPLTVSSATKALQAIRTPLFDLLGK